MIGRYHDYKMNEEIIELLQQLKLGEALVLNYDDSGNGYIGKMSKEEASQQARSWDRGVMIETWLFKRIPDHASDQGLL
jgi:hypothetical protein